MEKNTIKQPRDDLTIARSVACLLIVNYHTDTLHVPGLEQLARGGFVFNTVFIALSGYLLMLGARSKSVDLAWLKRRMTRIYPALGVSILLVSAIYPAMGLIEAVTLRDLLLYLTGMQYFAGLSELGPHLWFISVLLLCYLLFRPAKHCIETKPKRYLFILILLFGTASFVSWPSGGEPVLSWHQYRGNLYTRISQEVHIRFLYHFIVFYMSMYYSNIETRLNLDLNRFPVLSVLLLFTTFGIYVLSSSTRDANLLLNLVTIVASILCAASFFWAVRTATPFLGKLLPCFAFLALVSYEMYIIHYAVIEIAKAYVSVWLAYPFVFVVTVVLATLIHRLVLVARQGWHWLQSAWP